MGGEQPPPAATAPPPPRGLHVHQEGVATACRANGGEQGGCRSAGATPAVRPCPTSPRCWLKAAVFGRSEGRAT